MGWLRLYDTTLDDPKVQFLPPELFKFWVNMLCLANRQAERGTLPGADTIAWAVRLDSEQVLELLGKLHEVGLLDWIGGDDGRYSLHGWDKRQFKSDDVNERVGRYRERRAALGGSQSTIDGLRATVLERDGGACVYCGSTDNLVLDHMVPIQQGGTDDLDNLAAACRRCNSGKAGRTPEEARYVILNGDAQLRYEGYMKRLHETVIETHQKQTQKQKHKHKTKEIDDSMDRGVQGGASAPVSVGHPQDIQETSEPQKLPTAAEHVDNFTPFAEYIWQTWPPREGKKLYKPKAMAALKRIPARDWDRVALAVENFAESSQARRGFPPNLYTWLKDEAWKDWLEPEQPTKGNGAVPALDPKKYTEGKYAGIFNPKAKAKGKGDAAPY